MAKNKNKLPEKRTMNLYTKGDKKKDSSAKKVILIVLLVLFILLGVIGRYALLIYKNSKLNASKEQLATYNEQLVDYKKVKTEYDRYSKNYYSEAEKALEDRTKMILCASRCVGDMGAIQSITITGNTATANVRLNAMHDVKTIVANFESFDGIAFVEVGNITRATSEEGDGTITATINYGIGQQIDTSQEVQ